MSFTPVPRKSSLRTAQQISSDAHVVGRIAFPIRQVITDVAGDDWFGRSVSLSADGSTALVGADLDDIGAQE